MLKRLKFEIDPLVNDILGKIPLEVWESEISTFLDPAMGGGQFIREIIRRLREHGHSDENIAGRVFGIENGQLRVDFAVNKYNLIGTYISTDFLSWETDMKFDVIVGNPPYQKQVGPTKTEPIWDKFVKKAFELSAESGYVALIHPSGWRNVAGRFTFVRNLLLSKQVEYLEIHNIKDGISTFGAETRYDWYVAKNIDSTSQLTDVTFEDGTTSSINLASMPFVPNRSYEKIASLIAGPGRETVEILYSRSAYGTDKEHINKVQTDKFKYPVVYMVRKTGEIELCWSSTNLNGHYNIPKIIWSNTRISSVGTFIDREGLYALTNWNFAIVDSPDILEHIQTAFKNPEFISLLEAISQQSVGINYRALATFRKDFWKEFA
jgi:hypothetical protein